MQQKMQHPIDSFNKEKEISIETLSFLHYSLLTFWIFDFIDFS